MRIGIPFKSGEYVGIAVQQGDMTLWEVCFPSLAQSVATACARRVELSLFIPHFRRREKTAVFPCSVHLSHLIPGKCVLNSQTSVLLISPWSDPFCTITYGHRGVT